MFLSNASLRRPVAMCCLIIALVLLGMNAYRKLGLEFLPKMDLPYITVVTVYPGASPADIETDVAKRIEDAVSQVDGLKHVTSSCMENVCQTLLEFNLGVDVNVAAMDVREKLDGILSDFPSSVERPVVLKYDVNAKPVVTMALTGDLSVDELYDYADNTMTDRLSVIGGVANVELLGGAKREVDVLLDRGNLAAAGLTSVHVMQALQEGIVTLPAGRVKENGSEYSVRFDAEYAGVDEIGDLQVAGRDGARRYIRDLGTVAMASEERRQSAFIDGKPCIGIRVVKKADANAVRVVEDVRKVVHGMRPSLPGGMQLVWVTDDGSFIKASVDSTRSNIIEGVVLTAIILFFFLYNWRATLVVCITMPLTIVISLFFLKAIGLTLNQSTLLAIGLSVGILVMDSIVVLESVVSHMQRTGDPWEAARTGTSEVAVAVIACAGTHVVVLIPIGMMSSMIGLFFAPFAWATLVVNLVSLLISFTLTPILCALLLRKHAHAQGVLGRMERGWNAGLETLADKVVSILRLIGRSKLAVVGVLALSALVFFHSLTLAPRLGFTFVSEIDKGEVIVKLEYPTRQDLPRTVERVHEVEAALAGLPSVRHLFTTVGKVEGTIGKSSEGVYLAQILLRFPDKTERKFSVEDVLVDIDKLLAGHTDCIVTASIPSPVGGSEAPIDMEIAGDSLPELEHIALAVADMARGTKGFTGVDTSVREGKPELRITPNRAVLADMGAPLTSFGLMMRANLEGMKAGVYRSGARTYDIRVKLAEEPGKRQVEDFQLPGGSDRMVPLASYAGVTEHRAPVQITRADKRRVVKFYSYLTPDLPLGTASKQLTAEIDRRGLLPAGYEYRMRGMAERLGDAVVDFLEAIIVAILLTYLALAAILESFTKSFLILTTIPFALVGVLWSLTIAGQSISIFVLLGGVMLVGIVVNNAVLILDRMALLRTRGVDAREAMLQAIKFEFRAVLMITVAAILGMLPLALGRGLGSEMRAGIGVSSVGGIAVSALLTFLVLPLVFMLFTRRPSSPAPPGDAA